MKTKNNSKNYSLVILVALSLLMLSMVSAVEVYAGGNVSVELDGEYSSYSIVGNASFINLEITQDGLWATITANKYSQEDSFYITFFNEDKEEVGSSSSSSGGSGGTEYVDRDVMEYVYIDRNITQEVLDDPTAPGAVTEKIVYKTPWWTWAIIAVMALVMLYFIFFRNTESIIEEVEGTPLEVDLDEYEERRKAEKEKEMEEADLTKKKSPPL